MDELREHVSLVSVELNHLKELMEARFKVVELGQDRERVQITTLAENMQAFMQDPQKTPVGRQVLQLDQRLAQTDHTVDQLGVWQNKVDGSIMTWQWITGFIGLGVVGDLLIRILKAV